jgi:hypothetical protein
MAGSQEGGSDGGGQNGATGQQTENPYASMTPQQRAARKAPVLSRRTWFAALVRSSDPHP